MKLSICENCGKLLQFEHAACRGCGAQLGFIPGDMVLTTLAPAEEGRVTAATHPGEAWRRCANAGAVGCNWLVPEESADPRCGACRLNRNLADMHVPGNREKWQALEGAKRRLIYALMRFGVPVAAKEKDGEARGLAFDFLAGSKGAPVMTGHANGLITINIDEADSAERERVRLALGEPYRTLLGHFRHEAGHFYWDLLVLDGGRLEESRAIFGDESESYKEALERYYENGPTAGWEDSHVSAYATMHPWEDFAETWTHYLHMVDTLDTAASFGLAVEPDSDDPSLSTEIGFNPYRARNFDRLVRAWLPLTIAVNSLNRSMGQPDLYPFALTPVMIEKLRFIHNLVHDAT
jgi:hypothetical protein